MVIYCRGRIYPPRGTHVL